VKFVRYLPEHGYEPVVLTGPDVRADRWTPEDASLASDVPKETRVIRLLTPPPKSEHGWRDRAVRWLDVEDPFRKWWVSGALAAGLDEEVDLVYASMSPFESGIAAAGLAARLGVPWIADLRDPWALDEMQVYPTRFHRSRQLREMGEVLASASAVIMNTNEAAKAARTLPELSGAPIVAIPNGYDALDFAGEPPARDDEAFRIVHTGYLHTGTGQRYRSSKIGKAILGGAIAGVDILTRSHVYLLEALEQLRATAPADAARIELHLAGVLSPVDLEVAARSSNVHARGYLPHDATIALIRSADLLFLPMHNLPPGTRARIVPGKTYEYIASGRPILAAVPDGDARDLLTRTGFAHICRPDDVDGMARAILTEMQRSSDWEGHASRAEVLSEYERRALTGRLAGVFDRLLERRPSGPELDQCAKDDVATHA
jgi:glycosyltransferase involved in cell wall biosynthesis